MGEVVDFPTAFEDNQEFIADMLQVRRRHPGSKRPSEKNIELADDDWEALPSTMSWCGRSKEE